MLSFGYNNPPPQRSAGNVGITSKYSLPKALAFSIFKAPVLSSFSYSSFSTAHNPSYSTQYPPNAQNTRSKAAPHASNNLYSHSYRTSVPAVYEQGTGTQQRGASRHYSIHASPTKDVLVYETSVSSNSISAPTASSTASSSTTFDLHGSPAMSVDDISSTMASSSTETLQSTLVHPNDTTAVQPSTAIYPPPLSTLNKRTPPHDRPFPSVSQKQQQSNSSKLSAHLDSNSCVSNGQVASRVSPPGLDLHGQTTSRMDRRNSASLPLTLDISRRVTVQDCPPSPVSSLSEGCETVNILSCEAIPPMPLPSASEVSQDRHGWTGRTSSSDKGLAEDHENRSRVDSNRLHSSEPQSRVRAISTNSLPLTLKVDFPRRSVRWKEDLVCPSPLPRRKGWFNRRGDQLWTNDGFYKPADPGTEFPDDLSDYPEPNSGWMNEIGVRIDLQHHLVPKAPTRSALKQPVIRRATV